MRKIPAILLVLCLLAAAAYGAETIVPGTNVTIPNNSIMPAKLFYTEGTMDNTHFYRGDGAWGDPYSDFQAQLNTKQALDADLTVLSYPSNWRLFYSNGSHAMTELVLGVSGTFLKSNGASAAPSFAALDNNLLTLITPGNWKLFYSNGSGVVTVLDPGADNTFLRSNGASAAPSWAAVSGGTGTVTSLDNTTMDNTVIGGTTPAPGNFTTLTKTGVTDAQFGYLANTTSDLQAQIDLKRGLDNATFVGTGPASFDNEVTATQFNSSGLDNTHFVNVADSAPPNAGVETVGDCYYDNTSLAWKCWDGDSWETPAVQTIGVGSNPTVDSAGKISIDTTADQLVYYGSSLAVLDARRTENATFKSPVSGDKAKFRKPYGMTVTSVGCVTDAATSAVLDVQECNANGASCTTILSSTITCGTTYGTGTVSDASIAAGNYVFFSVGTVTGTVGYLYADFNYVVSWE